MPRSNYSREPQLLSLRVWSLCSATREAAIVRGPRTAMKSGPCLPQLEKALAQKWRPNTAKSKLKKKKIIKKKKTSPTSVQSLLEEAVPGRYISMNHCDSCSSFEAPHTRITPEHALGKQLLPDQTLYFPQNNLSFRPAEFLPVGSFTCPRNKDPEFESLVNPSLTSTNQHFLRWHTGRNDPGGPA